MRNFKYFLYARKSSESEDRQMASIEDQIKEVKKVAEKYSLQIIDIIAESKSAKEPGRVGFNSMLKRIHKGEAEGILTWKLNRLARNPVDGGQISWMLQQNIIKHIQTFEREYHPTDNVLLMQIEFGMANQYVKDLSLDVRRGLRQKAERGWYPSTRLPVGYMHKSGYSLGAEDEIIPHPEQFLIVKRLWKLFTKGNYSIVEMKRQGDILGLSYEAKKTCSKNVYYKIFTNEFYCGYFSWKDKNGNVVRYKGKHKAMISSAEFQKAQILLSEKINSTCQGRSYNFPYRGIIKCGECGCSVSPDHKLQVICTKCKRKYSIKTRTDCPRCNTDLSKMDKPSMIDILYYHCSKSKGKCSQGSITRDMIEVAIEQELARLSINQEQYDWAIEFLDNDKREEDNKENTKVLRKRKTELENRLTGLITLRADNEINSEQYNQMTIKTQKELSTVEFEILETENQNINWENERKESLKFSLEALERFKNADDGIKTKMVKEFASNLTLLNKSLVITKKKSFSDLKNTFLPIL